MEASAEEVEVVGIEISAGGAMVIVVVVVEWLTVSGDDAMQGRLFVFQ